MAIYQAPKERLHRDFFYLNDEIAINSLSALESGKVDEIVSRTSTAREGGFSGELKLPVVDLGVGGSRKATSEIEEEMVRKRTRFSILDAWYRLMQERKGLGTFEGWGPDALEGVVPGDTVELRGGLSQGSLQTVFRLYLWFAEQATRDGNMFSQKGEERKTTVASAKNVRQLLGDADDEVPLLAVPLGDDGPSVLLSVSHKWLIGRLGQLGGTFGIVGQVVQIVEEGEEYPVPRLTKDVVPTPVEIDTLKTAVEPFVEPAKALGIDVEASESVINGPVLVINPIAIYR